MKTIFLFLTAVLLVAGASSLQATVSRYSVLNLQAAYGADLQFRGMSKGGVLTAETSMTSDGLPILVRVQNGVRTNTPVEVGNYAPFNNQGYSYNDVLGSLHTLTVDRTNAPTGFTTPANNLNFGDQNRQETIVGRVPGGLPGIFPTGGFIYNPTSGGSIIQEMGGVHVLAFDVVNEIGYLVGSGISADLQQGGTYLWVQGQPAIQLVRSDDSYATAINNAAQVVGRVGNDVFFWEQGVLTRPIRYSVPDPANPGVINEIVKESGSSDISESGMVVGGSAVRSVPGFTRPASGVMGWIYTKEDGLVWLDDLIDPALGYQITGGITIGDDGTIYAVGYLTGTNQARQFLLTPLPEPSSLLLLGSGLYFLSRRRRA